MNKKLELAQDKFINHVGNMCNKFGLNNFLAQLFAVLYLSNKPVSLDELSERLKASKGNVSINIRALENWGAVKKIWIKGSRKDFYQAEADLKKILSERIKTSMHKHMAEVSDMLGEFDEIVNSAKAELTAEEKAIAKVCQERLKKIKDLKSMVEKALGLAERFL